MVPIPEGSETHSEESDYTDYGTSQEMLDQPTDLRGNGGDGRTIDTSNCASGSGYMPNYDIPI